MALDAEKHLLYVLADGYRGSESKHDPQDEAAASIFSVSTEVHSEELEATELVGPVDACSRIRRKPSSR